MDRPRVLVFSHAMELGGAETALLGLLESLDPERVDVDLFLMRHMGELLPYFPKWVNLLPESADYSCLAIPITSVIKDGKLGIALNRYRGKRAAVKRVSELGLNADNQVALEYSHKFTLANMPYVGEGEYDLAISFLTPHYFVANRVKAKHKVAWIHTDYSFVDVDVESEVKMWAVYDNIVSISSATTKGFLSKFPSLENEIIEIENILPVRYIEARAKESSNARKEMQDDGRVKLLSIGRFSPPKNFDSVPAICKRIKEFGVDCVWYLIGYGGDEALIREKIAEVGAEGYVVIIGKRENPYPYIKACDLYVQPSRFEGKSVAVREAQLLGKPVVITDFPTSGSQLVDGRDGVVVPLDNEGCAKGIANAIRDRDLQERLVTNCLAAGARIAGQGEIEKFYNLI